MLKAASLLVVGSLSLSAVACSNADSSQPPVGEAEARAAKPRTHIVCREFEGAKMKQRTVVLQQTDDQGLTEGKKLAFTAELYEGADVIATREASGHAQTEDVMFDFASSDGAFEVSIFMDEPDQSSLRLDGKDAGNFVCHRAAYVCAGYDRASQQVGDSTVVLHHDGEGSLDESVPHPFTLERFAGPKASNGETTSGTVTIEDVSFEFASKDGKLGFHVFLDEMNESGLTIDGKSQGSYVCR